MHYDKQKPYQVHQAIDGSVLMLFAHILVYAGSIFGVKIYIKDLIKRANE